MIWLQALGLNLESTPNLTVLRKAVIFWRYFYGDRSVMAKNIPLPIHPGSEEPKTPPSALDSCGFYVSIHTYMSM